MPISPTRMASTLAAALIFALPSAALAQTTDPCAEASGCVEEARSASAFTDSVGVNTHLGYTDQVYGTAWPMIRDRLVELAIKHVRDASYRDGTRVTDVAPRMRELASRGIRGNLLSGDPLMRWGAGTIDQHLAWVKKNVPGFVESLEGPNEYDYPSNDPDWERTLRAYQCEWAQKIRADPVLAGKRVIGPAPGGVGFDTLGDLSGCLDAGNLHPYPGSWAPNTSNVGDLSVQISGARKVSGSKPIWITESGYHNAVNCSCGHEPVSETASGIYVPRMFMEYFRRGIPRTYAYELIDGQPDPPRGDPQRNFGLLRNDGTPKPAFTATRNLLTILADAGPASGQLSFKLACESSCGAPLRHVLLRKTSGAYYLAVWPESSVWNASTRTDHSTPAQQVELRLPTRSTIEVFDPARSSAAIDRRTSTVQRLHLSDGMLVVRIVPPSTSKPAAKNAPSGQPSATSLAQVDAALAWTTDNAVRQLRRSGASRLRHRGTVKIAARAATPGQYTIRLHRKGAIARGRRSFDSAGRKRLVLRRTPAGTRLIRRGSGRRLVLQVTFVDRAGSRFSLRRNVALPR